MTHNEMLKAVTGWVRELDMKVGEHRMKAFNEELGNIRRDGKLAGLSNEFKRTADDLKWRLAHVEGVTMDIVRDPDFHRTMWRVAEQAYSQVFLLVSRVERLEQEVAHLKSSDKYNDTILAVMAEEIAELKEKVNGKNKKR